MPGWKSGFKERWLNVAWAVSTVLTGTITGAGFLYVVAEIIYVMVYGAGPVANGDECARGEAIAWLSLFFGGVGGFAAGVYTAIVTLGNVRAFDRELRGSTR